MNKKEFIDKWLIGYEDLEQKLEFTLEMEEDLSDVIRTELGQEKPAKEEREWQKGGTVRITKKYKGNPFNVNDEVKLQDYDEDLREWYVLDENDDIGWWITTEEAVLISKNQNQ